MTQYLYNNNQNSILKERFYRQYLFIKLQFKNIIHRGIVQIINTKYVVQQKFIIKLHTNKEDLKSVLFIVRDLIISSEFYQNDNNFEKWKQLFNILKYSNIRNVIIPKSDKILYDQQRQFLISIFSQLSGFYNLKSLEIYQQIHNQELFDSIFFKSDEYNNIVMQFKNLQSIRISLGCYHNQEDKTNIVESIEKLIQLKQIKRIDLDLFFYNFQSIQVIQDVIDILGQQQLQYFSLNFPKSNQFRLEEFQNTIIKLKQVNIENVQLYLNDSLEYQERMQLAKLIKQTKNECENIKNIHVLIGDIHSYKYYQKFVQVFRYESKINFSYFSKIQSEYRDDVQIYVLERLWFLEKVSFIPLYLAFGYLTKYIYKIIYPNTNGGYFSSFICNGVALHGASQVSKQLLNKYRKECLQYAYKIIKEKDINI